MMLLDLLQSQGSELMGVELKLNCVKFFSEFCKLFDMKNCKRKKKKKIPSKYYLILFYFISPPYSIYIFWECVSGLKCKNRYVFTNDIKVDNINILSAKKNKSNYFFHSCLYCPYCPNVGLLCKTDFPIWS